ncbi:hypothetical protein C8R43DRAFT_1101284 [Mycena crocata]|nr:hypothetical protein C8R43DRAFT_1101284 [Mycena crocata]
MSNGSSDAGPSIPPDSESEIILEADGYAVCPRCKERIKCGPGGIQNLRKRHIGKKVCEDAARKKSQAGKSLKDGSIFGFLRKKPKPVPPTVTAPAPIQVVVKPASIPLDKSPLGQQSHSTAQQSQSAPVSVGLLAQLEAAIKELPATVEEATGADALAAFAGDPAGYVAADLPAVAIYEELNPIFHSVLGYSMSVEQTAEIMRRGRLGLDGLVNLLKYFIEQRGVREQDFDAKIRQVLNALTFLTPDLSPTPSVAFEATPPPETHGLPENDADEIEIIAHTPVPVQSPRCDGFIFPLRDDQTFSSTYPVLLHDKFNLPWDFSVRQGVLYLTSRNCTGSSRSGHKNCSPCADLKNNTTLKGIISRSEEGVHENANLMYQPPAALAEIIRRNYAHVQGLRLGVLTSSRKLLTQASSLSDYKRFVVAVGSGEVKRADRVVSACIRHKRGIRGMLETFVRAARGLYHPANSEEEVMIGLAIWKLSGFRVAEIAHRALGLPGVTTLRNRMITPPLTASPGAPQVEHIQKNIDAVFAGIMEALAAKNVVHQTAIFDEISTEERLRWDPRTNYILGVCRQHAHEVGLEFNGEKDLDALFDALTKKPNANGKLESLVHIAREATIGAVGIMSEDTRLYSARPILISGDCKRESGQEHADNVLEPLLQALASKKDVIHLRTICLASDGETRRGNAFMIKTWQKPLSSKSNIHLLLKDLKFMNFMVGEDDLTGDKDPKHVDKRLRNVIIRPRGIRVVGIDLKPAMIRTHLQSVGHTADHIRASFNPEDKQDVGLAFRLLKDIWSLPPCAPGTSPGISAARDAQRILGKLLYHFVSPYICVDFSLSEQLEHLSAAAHLALALFRKDGKHFMASLLYTDIMIIIKNVFFCVAKAKVDDPLGKFWIILLGTDRLEELFGILRTMIGNDTNCDMLQILDRLRGTTEVSTILTKYPHWDRTPRRLRLPAMTRDLVELSDGIDHIKSASVRGDMRVQEVTLLTCWKGGRRLVETDYPWTAAIFKELEAIPGLDILTPHGKASFDDLDPDDNEDDETESPSADSNPPPYALSTDLEDAAEEELEASDIVTPLRTPATISHSITVDGKSVRKARALSQRLKYGKKQASTDRTRRVAGIARHSSSSTGGSEMTEFDSVFGGPCLMISDLIATLVCCDGMTFLCLGEVNDIYLHSESVDSLGLDVLAEQSVHVSFQFLKVIPATIADDASNEHDWKSAGPLPQTLKIPGSMVQTVNPTLSTAHAGTPCYLFESSSLRILAASLFEQLTSQTRMLVPVVTSTKFFPYREAGGKACFVCEADNNSMDLGAANTCPACPGNTPLDPRQGLKVLGHIGAHILFDPKIDRSTQPCGCCLNPSPMCEFFLTTSGKKKINPARSKCPSSAIKFTYSVAANSSPSSPCSNVQLNCPLCGSTSPAVFRYNFLQHLKTVHPTAPVDKYTSVWQLSPVEMKAMKTLWDNRAKGVPIPTKRKSKATYSVSDAHSSRLSMRPVNSASITFIDNSELPEPPVDSDEESANETTEEDEPEGGELRDDSIPSVSAAPATEDVDMDMAGDVDYEAQSFHSTPNIETTPNADILMQPPATPVVAPASQAANNPPTAAVEPELGRGKRKKTARSVLNLRQCYCDEELSSSCEKPVIRCQREKCQTQWYHLDCVHLDSVVEDWICHSCLSADSDDEGRRKRVRRG